MNPDEVKRPPAVQPMRRPNIERAAEEDPPDAWQETLNGDCFLGTQEGEDIMTNDFNAVWIPEGMVLAKEPMLRVPITVVEMDAILSLNATALKIAGKSAEVASRVAWLRLLAVKNGLVSNQFAGGEYFVDNAGVYQTTVANRIPGYTNDHFMNAAAVKGHLTAVLRQNLTQHFTDIVCCVAFVFRARGHHWTADLNALYQRVETGMRWQLSQVGLNWQDVALFGLHAIIPVVLDNFWVHSANRGIVNGALVKRLNCAPAGSAAPHVLEAGIKDLSMIAPGVQHTLAADLAEVKAAKDLMAAHRFNGSVNARYYGAVRRVFDEEKIGAIAAVIYHAILTLADESPLARSPALVRIANRAPITGAVMATAVRRIADRPETVNVLMIAPP
jgi:hypothetical protein